jgi:hypothetical protein
MVSGSTFCSRTTLLLLLLFLPKNRTLRDSILK